MTSARSLVCAASLVAVLGAACDGGRKIRLGDSSPPPYHFEPAVLIGELAQGQPNANATLTADLLEIFFTGNRDSRSDVWHATRGRPDDPFGPPAAVTEVNGDTFETSAGISADGLTLWFGSDRDGGAGRVDVWVSVRPTRTAPWSSPVNVVALNSADDDIPRPPGLHEQVMPLSSTKATAQSVADSGYHMYLAARSAVGAPFAAPVLIPELDQADRSAADGFLSDDGLTLFFSSAPVAMDPDAGPPAGRTDSDLQVAWRRSTSEPFSITQALDDLNTTADELDPWLTPDGTTLYFTSNRDGVSALYTARVKPR